MKTIHITSGNFAFAFLKVALSDISDIDIINLKEYFTLGPLLDLNSKIGKAERVAFFNMLFKTIYAEELSLELKKHIGLSSLETFTDSNENIVLWSSQDTHEQILLRALCTLFPRERIQVIDVSAHIKSKHGSVSVPECSPTQLLSLLPFAKSLQEKEYKTYASEWQILLKTDSLLRLYKNAKIQLLPEDHYDKHILNACSHDFENAAKAIGIVMGSLEENIGDAFLDYRLRALIKKGDLILKKNWDVLYKMEVKLA